ncbi:MAG TPA: DMT family transporter [Paenalcaligenes sp.]|nr:DMT family transporter [Paenalcaligenes sp.]
MSLKHAYLAIHLAALFFGLAGIFGALIHASAEFITMARALFATLVLLLLLVVRRGPLIPRKIFTQPRPLMHLLGAALFLSLHWLSFFLAIKKGGVAIATLGFASFPAFTIVVEFVLARDPMYRNDVLAIALITLGLILVNPSFSFHDQATIGLLWGVFSGFSFALFTFLNKGLSQQASALQIALWQNIGVLLLSLPWTWGQMLGIAAADWFWSAMLGIFCTAFAHYLIIRSLQRLKARHAGIVIALEPVYAIFFAAILFQQYPNLKIIIGAILIIGTIIWSQRQQQRLDKS